MKKFLILTTIMVAHGMLRADAAERTVLKDNRGGRTTTIETDNNGVTRVNYSDVNGWKIGGNSHKEVVEREKRAMQEPTVTEHKKD